MAPPQLSTLLRPLRLPRTTQCTSLLPMHLQQATLRLYASQSYGGGQGDPKGENPQEQGSNPATSNAEHPGPAPPDVGKGTGGGPIKKGEDGHSGSKTTSGEGEGKQTSGGPLSEGAPQPKIHQDDAPLPEDQSDDVKAHNADMAKRHEKPHEGSREGSDEVDKGFWKGQGGADRDP